MEAGGAKAELSEGEMGKGEELMMTKRDLPRAWVLNSGRPKPIALERRMYLQLSRHVRKAFAATQLRSIQVILATTSEASVLVDKMHGVVVP